MNMNNGFNNQQQMPNNFQQSNQPMVPNWNRPTTTTPYNNGNGYNMTGGYQSPNPIPTSMNMQSAYIPGRMVNDISEIRPNEVPMDGSVSLFPINNGSCIYVKCWSPDGTIKTMKYVPEQIPAEPQGPTEFEQLMSRLNAIEKKLSYNTSRKPYHSNQKKEEVVQNGN